MTKTDVINLLRELKKGNQKDLKKKDNEIIRNYLEGKIEAFKSAIRLVKLIRKRA